MTTTVLPEDPTALRAAADELRAQARSYDRSGELLRGLSVEEWVGEAADRFRAAIADEHKRWFDAADALESAASALDDHAATAGWARDRLRNLRDREQATWAPGANLQVAERERGYLTDLVSDVAEQVGGSGEDVARRLDAIAELAPRVGRVGSESFYETAQRHTRNAGADLLNSFASAAEAAQDNPVATAEVALGLLGLLGVGAGVVFSATGVGAAVGVPLVAASAGAVAVGGAQLARDASARAGDGPYYKESAPGSESGRTWDRVTPDRRTHILDGELKSDGRWSGGHRAGSPSNGSKFPAEWSDDEIIDRILDVANDPASLTCDGDHDALLKEGMSGGRRIRVVISWGRIVTGFPIGKGKC